MIPLLTKRKYICSCFINENVPQSATLEICFVILQTDVNCFLSFSSVNYAGDYEFQIYLGQPTPTAAKSVSWTVSLMCCKLVKRLAQL